MIRYLGILLLIYLVYKIIKMLFFSLFSKRFSQQEPTQRPPKEQKNRKIISKDEGEYVDFEELDEK